MKKEQKLRMGDKAIQDIRFYGTPVLKTACFKQAFTQLHHNRTSVGMHTLNVSMTSLRMSYMLEKLHIDTNREELVIGTLCHDLGILGRYHKFDNSRQCCHQHPIDSVQIARKLVPNLNQRTEKIIRRHMFPLTLLPPTNREGVIVSIADKYCAIKELVGQPLIQDYQAAILGC